MGILKILGINIVFCFSLGDTHGVERVLTFELTKKDNSIHSPSVAFIWRCHFNGQCSEILRRTSYAYGYSRTLSNIIFERLFPKKVYSRV